MVAAGTKDDPWVLQAQPGTSGYTMYRDGDAEPALPGRFGVCLPPLLELLGLAELTHETKNHKMGAAPR